MSYAQKISKEFNVSEKVADNILRFFNEGATVPFIARYRKEWTDSMNEEVVAEIKKRVEQLQELDKRKEFVVNSISEQGKLSPELEKRIAEAETLQDVEDLYLPFKPKRRTKAEMARQKGLEPLAKLIMAQNSDDINGMARRFVSKKNGVETEADALDGACDIMAEWISENINGRNKIRKIYHRNGIIKSTLAKGKEADAQIYKQYFDFSEPISRAASHRILALFRAEGEGLLKVKLEIEDYDAISILESIFLRGRNSSTELVKEAIKDSWKRLLEPSIESEIRAYYKQKADEVAVKVFAENLRQLLLAPPLGQKRVMAIDPGFRSGCKLVILNEYGELVYNETIFPNPPQRKTELASSKVRHLVSSYKVQVIAIGNGTAGRETEDFIKGVRFDRDMTVVMVNENGASVYSASKVARDEFPDYDITVRGAVSIGRRLMDPLAELVKIDPKSIGVGQYQHDVNQKMLNDELGNVVESCVNAVGVELNSASEQLLSYVSGVGPQLASSIVKYRNENGGFKSRKQLLAVPRLGSKSFEQCAGFLRIHGAEQPLDASAVHPESYHVVEKMARKLGVNVRELIGNQELISKIKPQEYVDDKSGIETINDIISELEKPGRDPRNSFEVFEFDKNIRTINDLRIGMELYGIVINITEFGCFVNIGIHESGFLHISKMSNSRINSPYELVKLNQKIKVKIVDIDIPLKRVKLSMK